MNCRSHSQLLVFALITLGTVGLLRAEEAKFDDSNERIKLYEAPDPQSPGGISGTIASPAKEIEQILAIPPDAPEEVYQGEITGTDKRGFQFKGLPMRKYDLIVIYDDSFYEGLQLHRGENSLTEEDLQKIDAIIQKSEPFFTKKFIHRAEGETGRGNFSRCITTFLRDKPSITYIDPKNAEKSQSGYFRRTFKLVILKDVGPGWQISRARDLFPVWANPAKPNPVHYHEKSLSRIRVADSIKDLGELHLESTDSSPATTPEPEAPETPKTDG